MEAGRFNCSFLHWSFLDVAALERIIEKLVYSYQSSHKVNVAPSVMAHSMMSHI